MSRIIILLVKEYFSYVYAWESFAFFTIAKLTIHTRINNFSELAFMTLDYKRKFIKNYYSGMNRSFCIRKKSGTFSCLNLHLITAAPLKDKLFNLNFVVEKLGISHGRVSDWKMRCISNTCIFLTTFFYDTQFSFEETLH